jgi:stage IV sporulation protein FA
MSNQKRRQERIQHLMDKQKVIGQHRSSYLPVPSDRLTIQSTDVPADPRMNDPEFVWKQRGISGWDPAFKTNVRERAVEPLEGSEPPVYFSLRNRFIFCILLFGLIWGMFQLHHPMALRGQTKVMEAMTTDFQFQMIAQWYNQTFQGTPFLIPAFDLKKAQKVSSPAVRQVFSPLEKSVIATGFVTTNQGITLSSALGSAVRSMDTGWVVYVNHTAKGNTVVIQHANQIQTVYGWVAEVLVRKNDWVKGGEQIGTVSPDSKSGQEGLLYFAVKQKNKYINPLELIPFD